MVALCNGVCVCVIESDLHGPGGAWWTISATRLTSSSIIPPSGHAMRIPWPTCRRRLIAQRRGDSICLLRVCLCECAAREKANVHIPSTGFCYHEKNNIRKQSILCCTRCAIPFYGCACSQCKQLMSMFGTGNDWWKLIFKKKYCEKRMVVRCCVDQLTHTSIAHACTPCTW